MGKRKLKEEALGPCCFWVFCFMGILMSVVGKRVVYPKTTLLVNLTLIPEAASSGAVCLDGTLPGYHLHRGHGSGANRWLVQIEGGGWCNTVLRVFKVSTRLLADFYHWNRVKLRYCDGASFSGSGQKEHPSQVLLASGGNFLSISGSKPLLSWSANMGSRHATVAHPGDERCRHGTLASILHCDEFQNLFPDSTKVKCLSDAGMFLDAVDLTGRRTLRDFFAGVVSLQRIAESVGGWYFERTLIEAIDCPYPSDPAIILMPS